MSSMLTNVDEGMMSEQEQEEFLALYDVMFENIEAVAKKVFEYISYNGGNRELIVNITGAPWEAIDRFYRIGAGEMSAKLIFRSSAGEKALMRCNLSEQERYAEKPIRVFCLDQTTGEPTYRLVHAKDMHTDQIRQVFNNGTIRNVREQGVHYNLQRETQQRLQRLEEHENTPPAPRSKVMFEAREYTYREVADILRRWNIIVEEQKG